MDPADALTAALERLPGVLAATAFLDTPAGPRLYLAAAPDSDHRGLGDRAYDLLRDYGYDCPRERIHVAAPPASTRGRAVLPSCTLDGLDVHRSDHQVECAIRLRASGRVTAGSAVEPDTPAGRGRAATLATLRAAERLDPDLRLGLEGLRLMDLFGLDAVVVLVEASAARSYAHLPGSALVERSVEEAAALATLQALRSWTL